MIIPTQRFLGLLGLATMLVAGCQAAGPAADGDARQPRKSKLPPVRRVVCMFDQRPWINADAAGDRDPEGLRYRVFLDTDTGKGVLREGTLHIEMYLIRYEAGKETKREMVSDWHYPTSQFGTVSANIMGKGYLLQLRWALKAVAGNEIEVITSYESPEGAMVRAGTIRRRVPKYVS